MIIMIVVIIITIIINAFLLNNLRPISAILDALLGTEKVVAFFLSNSPLD